MQASQVHALMMASNVSVECSATGTKQIYQTPARPNKDPHYLTQPATVTLQPAEGALIYFHNFAKLTAPPQTLTKSVGKKAK